MVAETRVSIVIPAYHEGEHIRPVPERVFASARLPAEVLVVVDAKDDPTVPVIGAYAQLRCLVNTYGRGYAVVGVDNYAKYGRVLKSCDEHPDYTLIEGDACDAGLMGTLLADCDHFIAGAAMIGGISYFHAYAYDLLAANERIIAASCDAAIKAHRAGRLRKVTYLSSSMVFESADRWPSQEGQQREIPPPFSSYGFQKLAVEYFACAAWDQQRGLQPLHRRVRHRSRAGGPDLAQDQWRGHAVADSSRRSVRARRPAPRARHREGQASPGLRGNKHAGADARRGDPVDRPGHPSGDYLTCAHPGEAVRP